MKKFSALLMMILACSMIAEEVVVKKFKSQTMDSSQSTSQYIYSSFIISGNEAAKLAGKTIKFKMSARKLSGTTPLDVYLICYEKDNKNKWGQRMFFQKSFQIKNITINQVNAFEFQITVPDNKKIKTIQVKADFRRNPQIKDIWQIDNPQISKINQ